MPAIMADHNVEGQPQVLLGILTSPSWHDYWESLSCQVHSFESLGIPLDMPDAGLWRSCQEHEIILITANRSAESADSLEATIRKQAHSTRLPVITIGDPDRIMTDRNYAERAAVQLLDYSRL